MAQINPGYMGSLNIQGIATPLRFSSASVSAKQEVEAPDLIMGDFNRQSWVYGKIEVGGSISGPVAENFAAAGASVWGWGTSRTACGNLGSKNITLTYFCGPENGSQIINGCLVNTISFSATAGEVAEFSLDVIGTSVEDFDEGATGSLNPDEEKLVTWDQVSVGISNGLHALTNVNFESFSFEVSNNVEARYAITQDPVGTQELFPFLLVPGLRTITGTLTAYNIPPAIGVKKWSEYEASDVSLLTFNIGGAPVSANVAFHRIEPQNDVGPITSTLAFTGVTSQPFGTI